ncbi:MAG: LysE family transporter [Polyangiaceae bacterium]|nr:LysE family transporter [Polyangiaceae bacterium]
MVAVALIVGLVLGFAGSIPAAGPLLLLVVASGLEGRRRQALSLAAGGALAESAYVALAFWGVSGIVARHPQLELGMHFFGAALLLVLGALLLRRRRGPVRAESGARGFVAGFVIVATNPGFVVTWSAVAAVVHASGLPALGGDRVPWLAAGAFAGIVLWFVLVAALAARHRERLTKNKIAKIVRGLGVVLLVLGALMTFSAFRRL